MEFEDKWKAEALAYIEREHSEERQAYLKRINPRYADERYEFVAHKTPGGVLVEAVHRVSGRYVERWRMTYGDVVVESGLDIALGDVTISVGGYEWETDIDVPGLPFSL